MFRTFGKKIRFGAQTRHFYKRIAASEESGDQNYAPVSYLDHRTKNRSGNSDPTLKLCVLFMFNFLVHAQKLSILL